MANARYNAEKSNFIKLHNTDEEFDFTLEQYIPYHAEHCLVYEGKKPCYTDSGLLKLLDLILFGWIQRYALNSSTKKVEYNLTKYIIS